MKKEIRNLYKYDAICPDCGKKIPIYFALADFYEPVLKKCKCCDALYWYDEDATYYIRPLEKQLEGKICEKCNTDLKDALVPTHTHIKCDHTNFSIHDNFLLSRRYDDSTEKIEVYLLYSET